MRTLVRFGLLAGALALPYLAPAIADAGCPAGCSCWTEDGISKMACSAPAASSPAAGAASAGKVTSTPGAGTATRAPDDADERWLTDEERRVRLEERQRQLDRQLLEVQRARFEARARGDAETDIARLEKSFKDIQDQRRATLQKLKTYESN
jgi:hypothetical protein